jgi:outer membrane protein OmpA-like peptidoglycan-associated protein
MKHKKLVFLILALLINTNLFAQEEEEKTEQTVPQEVTANVRSNTQYDFVPGDKILFYEDFSQDAIGDFPALWTTSGSGEVRTVENVPGNWLYFGAGYDVMLLQKPLNLPDNFIFEFDLIAVPHEENEAVFDLSVSFFNQPEDFDLTDYLPGSEGFHIKLSAENWQVIGYKSQEYNSGNAESSVAPIPMNKPTHIIVWVQKRRVRIYHLGRKVLDGPTVLTDGIKLNRLRFWGGEKLHPLITNIKITTASPDMRNKLLTDGKLVSYGIYFDVNKDVVKPESYGTLKEIAKVLNEVPAVKVKIVGHTDADGADAANLDLSKRRAASVKAELVKSFGVNGDRLITDGMGEGQPIAPNTTAANKALNRRVEFIKQ